MHFSAQCPTWEDKPLITTACVGWGSSSVAAPSQKSLQKKCWFVVWMGLFGVFFFMSAMIFYSLSSHILMLLIWQRGLIQPAVHARSASTKWMELGHYFLLVMGLEEKTLFLSHISRSLLERFSSLLLTHSFALAHYVTVPRPHTFAPKSKGLQGFSPVYNSNLNNHQRIKEYPKLEGTLKEHPNSWFQSSKS